MLPLSWSSEVFFQPMFQGLHSTRLQLRKRQLSGQANFFMSKKLTSLFKDFDHSAKMIWAKSIRQAAPPQGDVWVLCTQWPTNEKSQQEDPCPDPGESVFSCQAYSLLEHEVPGQGLMFLLWSSGKGHTLIPCQLNKVLLFMLPNKKGGTQCFP